MSDGVGDQFTYAIHGKFIHILMDHPLDSHSEVNFFSDGLDSLDSAKARHTPSLGAAVWRRLLLAKDLLVAGHFAVALLIKVRDGALCLTSIEVELVEVLDDAADLAA